MASPPKPLKDMITVVGYLYPGANLKADDGWQNAIAMLKNKNFITDLATVDPHQLNKTAYKKAKTALDSNLHANGLDQDIQGYLEYLKRVSCACPPLMAWAVNILNVCKPSEAYPPFQWPTVQQKSPSKKATPNKSKSPSKRPSYMSPTTFSGNKKVTAAKVSGFNQ